MRKEQGIMYKNTTQKLKIEQYEPHKKKTGVNSGAPECWAVSAPHMAPDVLVLLQARL